MRLSKVVLVVAAVMLFTPAPSQAQFLKNIGKELKKKAKEEGERIKSEIKQGAKSGSKKGGGSATNDSGIGRSVGGRVTDDATSGASYKEHEQSSREGNLTAEPNKADMEIPASLSNVRVSTFHRDYQGVRDYNMAPKMTSSTVHIVLDREDPSFSDFHDGVAYVYCNGKAFYINERGEKLFDSYVVESDESKMPRFCNGVVLEAPTFGSKINNVVLRDRSGNTVKEFNAKACTNFVNGVAALAVGKTGSVGTELKYIDTKGNFVFENLTCPISSAHSLDKNILGVDVANNEGLVPFPKSDKSMLAFKYGFRDATGRVVIEAKYDAVRPFKDGMAAVYVAGSSYGDGKWGFVDKTGREVIPPSFSIVPSDFDSGYCRVITKNNEAYLIDKSGTKRKGPFGVHNTDNEGDLVYISPFFNGYALMGSIANFGDDSYPINYVTYSVVDKNFNKQSWFDREAATLHHSTPIFEHDGMVYLCEDGSSRAVSCHDPRTFDMMAPYLNNPYVNGYSRFYGGGISGGVRGFVNKDFEYVIAFEENEF